MSRLGLFWPMFLPRRHDGWCPCCKLFADRDHFVLCNLYGRAKIDTYW